MKIRHIIILSGLLAAFAGQAATNSPSFDEVYNLLRTHLDGVSKADLDSAAIKGLLAQISSEARLISGDGTNNAPADTLGRSTIYDDSFAYFRLAKIDGDIDAKLKAAYHQLGQTNKTKIKGVILDLRSAGGGDYSAAGMVANCFLSAEQPLLNWGTGSINSTKKDDAIAVPVAVLVNSETSGAAEALAAVIRETHEGLLVGGKTAGEARLFKDFPLSNGEKLRIATAQVKLGNGAVLSESLQPDIPVETGLADDKIYLQDPYKTLRETNLAAATDAGTNAVDSTTNLVTRHRLNEAELVREQKEGADLEEEFGGGKPFKAPPDHPLLKDPALLRALDVLKGLAVVQLSHPS